MSLRPGAGHAMPEGIPDAQFDVIDWYPKFQSCVRYLLDHGQYNGAVQAIAAFINIQLPFQSQHPVLSSNSLVNTSLATANPAPPSHLLSGSTVPGRHPIMDASVTLVPYVRRLVATGFDFPSVLHGFFGRDWLEGVGPLHDIERRNYLFAAKSDNWLKVKASYDMGDGQFVPFLKPLQKITEEEIEAAEATWSEWLAMQDWMLGPRAPAEMAGVRVKTEEQG
ncbi:hypothetical protein VUR80DRAFT_782 [Thermomyces stellatus]